jgi:hypothetical protein
VVNDFLAKNNVTTLQNPAHSPGLNPADFNLLLRLKSTLKVQRLRDSTDIIKNATEELKRLSQNGCQKCFQHLYYRWRKCIFAQGDNCEGNVVQMVVLFGISRK